MGSLRGAYLIASAVLLACVYRSNFKTALRKRQLQLLLRPVAVLAIAYVAGLNVPSIAESLSSLISPRVTEPLFYLVTLVAVVGLTFVPTVKPFQDDNNKSI